MICESEQSARAKKKMRNRVTKIVAVWDVASDINHDSGFLVLSKSPTN